MNHPHYRWVALIKKLFNIDSNDLVQKGALGRRFLFIAITNDILFSEIKR